ncbi:MAG TPA: pyrroloquinoline quinone-dependent dehydrogenase [Gemmatimonadaceae bacterium]|nr:pyrroloquinoline quinone-dependent dehydrogenase [Gemmatimonadaceae bacterium]
MRSRLLQQCAAHPRVLVAAATACWMLGSIPFVGRLSGRVAAPGLLLASVTNAARSPGRFPASDWPAASGADGAHYSPLDEITPRNVRSLRVAWVYRTGDVSDGRGDTSATAFETTPVMIDGTLYLSTPFSRVIALDAETGAERWTFDPHVDRAKRLRHHVTSRGVATWRDLQRGEHESCAHRILVATIDARLIALDAASGAPCATFGNNGEIDLRAGVRQLVPHLADYRQTSPPAVVGDVVVLGSSITDNGRTNLPSGVVRGFDARTGAQLWAWEPLIEASVRDANGVEHPVASGAANAWSLLSVDTLRNLVFVPTGSASPDHFGGMRPGSNKYANSVVALDARTGRVAWGFQLVHHDLWDYDVGAQPALAEIVQNGRRVPVVIASSKASNIFYLHRESGAPVHPVEERAVPQSDVPGEFTSPTQPFSVTPPLTPQGLSPDDAWGLTPVDRAMCRRIISSLRSEGIYTPPSVRGSVVYPGFIGGVNWGGFAVDADRGIFVTVSDRIASVATLVPRERMREPGGNDEAMPVGEQARTPYGAKRDMLMSPLGLPCTPPPWGTLVGVDLATGRKKWEVPLGTMSDLTGFPTPKAWGSVALGGPLTTASGVVFIGASMDRRLHAFDIQTGDLLWDGALPASAQATPMTYRARPGGRQYVVISAGGHALMRSALGDYVIAWALP